MCNRNQRKVFGDLGQPIPIDIHLGKPWPQTKLTIEVKAAP